MSQSWSELLELSKTVGLIAEAISLGDSAKIDALPTHLPSVGEVRYVKERNSDWKILKLNPGSEATEITTTYLALLINRMMQQFKVSDDLTVMQLLENEAKFEQRVKLFEKQQEQKSVEHMKNVSEIQALSDELDRKDQNLTQLILDIEDWGSRQFKLANLFGMSVFVSFMVTIGYTLLNYLNEMSINYFGAIKGGLVILGLNTIACFIVVSLFPNPKHEIKRRIEKYVRKD